MTTSWQNVNIGGGGFVTSVSIANDGTQVIRCDVYGAYVNTPAVPTWRQMQTGTAFGNQTVQSGPYEVVIAPSDSTRIYMLASDGFLYSSTNTGATFTKNSALNSGVALSGDYGGNRSESTLVFATRLNGRYMAVDPNDPNVLYVCSQTNGTFLTLNGGSTWQTISGIAAATTDTGISLGTYVAIDAHAATVNGRSPNVYIMAYGSQMYKCSNGGSATPTFAATTSGPTTICNLAVDQDGTVVYAVDNSSYGSGPGGGTSGSLWAYNVAGASWANQSTTFTHACAPDPATGGRIILSDDVGGLSVSTTHGSSLTVLTLGTKNFNDIPWMNLTPNTLYSGQMAINPSTGKLLLTEGIGCVTTTVPSSGAVNWTNQTIGIEELVTNFVSSSPSYAYPLAGFWDRPLFAIQDPNTFPATQQPNNSRAITMGWAGDWAKSASGTQVAIVNFTGAGDDSGISINGGTAWTNFATKPNKVRLVTTASSALNSGTFTFGGGVPSLIAPTSLGGSRQAIYLGIAAVTTSSSAANSQVLHFGGGLPAGVTVPCAVMTDDQQIINGLLFDSAITLNSPSTGDVQLDGGPHVTIPTGTRIFFVVDGSNAINGNVFVSATSGTTVTMTNEPSGHSVVSGATIEFTSGLAGCISASTPSNIIWCGSNQEPYPWYTKNGGTTWANVIIGTSTAGFGSSGQALLDSNGYTGWGAAYYVNNQCFAADTVTANRFVCYNGRADAASGAGVYVSTDSGDTWTRAVSGTIDSGLGQFNSRILGVPSNAHHFFFSPGSGNFVQNSHLSWSTDASNATWTTIANISNVVAFGVGKNDPSKNYPTVYVMGQWSGTKGIWQGVGNLSDWQAGSNTGSTVTWTNINGSWGQLALDWLNGVTSVEGDQSVFGRVYIGRGQAGIAMGSLDSGPVTPAFGFSVITDSGQRRTRMIGY